MKTIASFLKLSLIALIIFYSCTKNDNKNNLNIKNDSTEDKELKDTIANFDSVLIVHDSIIADSEQINGNVIGYLKCRNKIADSLIFGLFIISENNDSLLAFNVPKSIYSIDRDTLQEGVFFLKKGKISFNFKSDEKINLNNIECPPQILMGPTFYAIENFQQILIIDIKR